MASVLDKIEAAKANAENQQLTAAAANANWANAFPSENTAAANVNLDDLVARATARKQQMLAQSDVKAGIDYARMKEIQARTQHAADMAPKNVQLRQQQFEHEVAATNAAGAHDRFLIQKDKQSADDLAGFFNEIAKIKAPIGTPEYQSELNTAIQKYPRVIGTQAGSAAVKKLFEEHQDVMALKPPNGMQIDGYEADDSGKLKARFKPVTVVAGFQGTPEEARSHYGQNADIHETAKGVWTATIKSAEGSDLKSIEKDRSLAAAEHSKARMRRDAAGRATAAAEKTTDEEAKSAALDLVKAADADVNEWQTKLGEAESQLRALRGGAAKTADAVDGTIAPAATPKQFSDEAAARAGGAKPGDIIILINPATGKPARARLN